MRLILAFILSLSVSTFAWNTASSRRSSVWMSTVDKNPIEAAFNYKRLEKIQTSSPKYQVSLESELAAMKNADIGRSDNFFENTLSNVKRGRMATSQKADPMDRIKIDENFYHLMNMGFDRRLLSEKSVSNPSYFAAPNKAADTLVNNFELNRSKKEQLEELKKQKLQERQQIFKFIPSFLHKYIDYLVSLKTKVNVNERNQILGFSTFFSFVVWANQGARSAFMYYVIGTLVSMSMLLQRGMPKVKLIPGQRRQVGTWSTTAFTTALAMTILFTVPSALLGYAISAIIPGISPAGRGKFCMIFSLFANSIMSLNFEVFEEKSKNGSRWRNAVKGMTEPDLEEKVKNRIFNKKESNIESYHLFEYNPEIDENPYQPKYLDELPGAAPLAGQGDLDEGESKKHFEQWKLDRQNGRRPPLVEAAPELPWMGGKAGMYVKPPEWLKSAYMKSVKKMNAWRGVPSKYKKDFSEFQLTTNGPFGFRDKHPEWLDEFGAQIWQEQLSISRALARNFGTYRKTMWKIDKEVQLQACDGADKEKEKKK